jgi:hypothetical protein
MKPTDYIYVPLHVEIYAELLTRLDGPDVSDLINDIINDYIERNECEFADLPEEYGDSSKGLRWQDVILPNGSEVKMTYKGNEAVAEIKNQTLMYEGISYSPSEFAREIAGGTARNAWKDLWISKPTSGSKKWKLADDMRWRLPK